MRGTIVPLSLAWMTAAGAAGGCSLFDQTGGGPLNFDLPTSTFEVKSTNPQWWPSPPYGVPYVVCQGPTAVVSDCCQLSASIPALDCQIYPLGCDDNGVCALAFDYDAIVEIDLGRDVAALQRQHGRVLAQATLAAFDTKAAGAGLAFLRTASLFVAPQGAVSSRTAGARLLASIPLEPTEAHVDLTADARVDFSSVLADFNTPFALILSTHVVVESILPPTAVAAISVTGKVDARF